MSLHGRMKTTETLMKRRDLLQLLGSSAAASALGPAFAQALQMPAGFPAKPIKIVVPFPPGGPADALARPLAKVLGDKLGQSLIIENKPGANTMIGASSVLASPADGYTLLLANEAGLSLAPAIAPVTKVDVPYNSARDFTGGALLAQYGSVLTVSPDLPVKTLPEFIAYAKANPGQLNYASFGIGSQPHMMMEELARQVGFQAVHVAFKGVAPATLELMAGRVQAMISAPSAPLPFIRDGKLRAIAYSGTRRLTLLPDVPTFTEGGLPGYEARGWFGIVMHASTPTAIRAALSEAMWQVIQSKDYQENAILQNGLEVPSVAPQRMNAFLAEDRAKWTALVREIKDRLV
jgi:tripartite-type tricarboxylate transporter receptor subunit TctC